MKGSASFEQTSAVDRIMERMRTALAVLPAHYLKAFSAQLERVTQEGESLAPPPPATRGLIGLLGGREYSPDERVTLEALSLLEEFRYRQRLLQDSLTAPQVAEILGSSRQAPHDRVKGGSLLAVMDRGALRFPTWQFDPEGESGVVEGLPRVVRALNLSPLGKIAWFSQPNPYLGGKTPLAVLKSSEIERVEELARGAGRT